MNRCCHRSRGTAKVVLFRQGLKPRGMSWVVTAVGLAGAALMVVYDRTFKPGEAKGGTESRD